jgi:hypothetical protein
MWNKPSALEAAFAYRDAGISVSLFETAAAAVMLVDSSSAIARHDEVKDMVFPS